VESPDAPFDTQQRATEASFEDLASFAQGTDQVLDNSVNCSLFQLAVVIALGVSVQRPTPMANAHYMRQLSIKNPTARRSFVAARLGSDSTKLR